MCLDFWRDTQTFHYRDGANDPVNRADPTGECAVPGLAQLYGGLIGAGAGLVIQGVSDVVTGSEFEPGNYLAAAAGGAAGGIAFTSGAGIIGAGAAAGGVQEGARPLLNGETADVAAGRAAVGAAAGAGTARLAPYASAVGRGPVSRAIRPTRLAGPYSGTSR